MRYESDEAFSKNAYITNNWRGIAWRVLGWETEPDEDTEWSGYEQRTGRIVAVMVGDDRHFAFEPDQLTPIKREEYCGICGQVGCYHDGFGR